MIAGLILAAGAGTRFGDRAQAAAPTSAGARCWSTRSAPSAPWPSSSASWSCSARTPMRCSTRVRVRTRGAGDLRGLERRARRHRCAAGLPRSQGADKVIVDARRRAAGHSRGDRAVRRASRGGTRAVYDGRPGHPVVLGAEQIRGAGVAGGRPGRTRCCSVADRRSSAASCARAATSTHLTTWRRFAMKLEQSFEVSAPMEQVWKALIDVERVAPCLPGRGGHRAQRRRQLQRHVHDQDRPDDRRLRRQAGDEGRSTRARTRRRCRRRATTSAARAARTRRSSRSSSRSGGETRVEVDTDYHITGRLARFGRGGMIEDISERLLREFASASRPP